MSRYYYPDEIKADLERFPRFIDKLYCGGFLLTDERVLSLSEYPFYGNWRETEIQFQTQTYFLYVHHDVECFVLHREKATLFLVGHAFNPYEMLTNENDILAGLYTSLEKNEAAFWKEESKLTGVFFIGFLTGDTITFSTDCAGMQLAYDGLIGDHLFVSSHSKLIADIKGLEQTEYVRRLTASRVWPWWGRWLPADISPFRELLRLNPNCKAVYSCTGNTLVRERYYPQTAIRETESEEEFQATIRELARVMSNTMECISTKWPEKSIAVSVSGGKDSMTTLAAANGRYNAFSYFSYISNEEEAVDAYAAQRILRHLGLNHTIYTIPEHSDDYIGIDVFQKVLQCNNGCIGANNLNDVKKRMYFIAHPPCDMEVKSWVNELGRGYQYNKYNKKRFPKYPYPAYWRVMHKVYLDPWLIKQTDLLFAEYMKRYFGKPVFDRLSWLELFFWEASCNACEGCALTSEQRVSYDITIPFNNRKYIETMLTVPLEKRRTEGIPNAMITNLEPRIMETGISVHDVSHTNLRAKILRLYLSIFSKIRFF